LDFSAFRYRCADTAGLRVNAGYLGPTERRLVEETDEHEIFIDHLGRTMKLPKGRATLALPLDYPVKTMEDWQTFKPRFQFAEERFARNWEEQARADRAAGRVLCFAMPGAFAAPRELLGDAALCVAYYEQPELVRDMLETYGTTCVRILERVAGRVQIDALTVHEDLAGKSGPLVGPAQVREFFLPYYQRVWTAARACGAGLFDQDSDGDIAPVIEDFLACGVNVFHPMEPCTPGMDVVQLRRQYGQRVAFYGGLDKHVLRRGKDAITAELEYKLPPLVASGGCVLGLDHRIPNGTPLESYRFYINRAWEILDREGAKL
jgi:hypothetical protein